MPFRPALFQVDHPDEPLPPFQWLDDAGRAALNDRAAERLGWADLDDWLRVPWVVFDQSASLPGACAAADGFRLDHLAQTLGLSPEAWVVIDWFGGDQLRFRWEDLTRYFDDLWQAGEDDLAVFDETFAWMLYVTRGGEVRYCTELEEP